MTIIAISRGTSSGGKALSELVAKTLGYPCVSREAIVRAAEWYGLSIGASSVEDDIPLYLDIPMVDKEAYLSGFRAALVECASNGNLVYHGHVGHLLLPGIPVLSVRVVADAEYRTKAVMYEHRRSREAAMTFIKKMDRSRGDWVRHLYGVEWDDPTLYDLVLNLSHLSLESACSAIVHMSHMAEFKINDSSLVMMDGYSLRTRVSAALTKENWAAGGRPEWDLDEALGTLAEPPQISFGGAALTAH